MAFLSLVILAFVIAAAGRVFANPEPLDNSTVALGKRSIPNVIGTFDGFYYAVFADDTVTGEYTNISPGQYSVTWGGSGDIVVGVGFNPGGDNQFFYDGTFEPEGFGLLSVYGWFTNPLVEYYIMESNLDFDPNDGGTFHGTCSSDGNTYDLYTTERVNEPSIQGTATFPQYLSIRTPPHALGSVSGVVTTANHFSCWESFGLPLGTFNEQIMAVEGDNSAGSATIIFSPVEL